MRVWRVCAEKVSSYQNLIVKVHLIQLIHHHMTKNILNFEIFIKLYKKQ